MSNIIERALALRETIEELAVNLDDTQALDNVELFPNWTGDAHPYAVGDRVKYHDVLYKCIQAHTSQSDWNPEDAHSLFAVVLIPDPEVIPDWVQPDSTNPYMTGDKVRYNGLVYESLIDGNVWSPDSYPQGWKLIGA